MDELRFGSWMVRRSDGLYYGGALFGETSDGHRYKQPGVAWVGKKEALRVATRYFAAAIAQFERGDVEYSDEAPSRVEKG